MIGRYDAIQIVERSKRMTYRRETDEVVYIESGAKAPLEDFLDYLRRHFHCNFEVIYSLPGGVLNSEVLRCKDCGAVIFTSGADGEDYDGGLCCPACGKYETHFDYWTPEEIEQDLRKQEELEYMIRFGEELDEQMERERKRGKLDSEIWKGEIRTPFFVFKLALKCINLVKYGVEGLHLEADYFQHEKHGGYIHKRRFTVPLGLSYLKTKINAR